MDETDYEKMAERHTKALVESMKQTISEHMTLAWYDPTNHHVSTDKLRAAAQPAQEPMHPEIKKMYEDYFDKCFRELSAQQRPWVGLTEEEKHDCYLKIDVWSRCVEAIEAKLKEKNT